MLAAYITRALYPSAMHEAYITRTLPKCNAGTLLCCQVLVQQLTQLLGCSELPPLWVAFELWGACGARAHLVSEPCL